MGLIAELKHAFGNLFSNKEVFKDSGDFDYDVGEIHGSKPGLGFNGFKSGFALLTIGTQMQKLVTLLFVWFVCLAWTVLGAEDGFRSLFNGKDLDDWDGNPALWSVEEGCITGKTQGVDTLAYNQFLIWRGGLVKDFELRAKVRVSAGNSGIQYRSREQTGSGKWSIAGYQCDIHPSAPNNGMLYEERGRGILSQNGQNVVLDPDGSRWLAAQREPVQANIQDWHEYTIVAQGNHLQHKIDGQLTMDFVDHDPDKRSIEGLIAFQLHRGPAMVLQVKDVFLKELPTTQPIVFDRSSLPADMQSVSKPKKAEPKSKNKASVGDRQNPVEANTAQVPVTDLKWIWHDAPKAGEGARLKKAFDVPLASVQSAVLQVTCDNGAEVYLNDTLALSNSDWSRTSKADVKAHLREGHNELRVEAKNKGGAAGFVGWLSLKMSDGSQRSIATDATWTAAEPNSDQWKAAKEVASYGQPPWGNVFNASNAEKQKGRSRGADAGDGVVTAPSDILAHPDFKVELVHVVAKEEQGSWVGLTVDDQGRLLATDQYGGLYRLTPPPIGKQQGSVVEKLDVDLTGAHGLLYAFDSLYTLVNEDRDEVGLWRLRDTQGDGQFDEKTRLRTIRGSGEHGVHSIALAPDGKSIYIACGNGTSPPESLEHTRLARPFGDDQVLPRINKGGSFSDSEPHAFTCQVSPDGKRFDMIVAGLRNHYDIAFNALGDLFTYDSDMEWDVGTPWYRPTRIYHLVSGGDYGFRESSGKLMSYCPDVVPPLVEVGPGSPTGLVSGLGTKFPSKYQNAIYACDWTYGTLYAVHLTPEGAGYRATLEEFITGKPLALTDAVVGKDGSLYFAVGGRRNQSAVYRVTYVGSDGTEPAAKPVETPEHRLRVELENLHREGTGPEAIDRAWPHLGHVDRFVRYAARVAIERQPVELWGKRALSAREPWALIESGVALAHRGGTEYQAALLEMLNGTDFAKLNGEQQLALIRIYQIAFSRNGVPTGAACSATLDKLDALYPAASNALNLELSRTLVALDSRSVVAKTLALMPFAKDIDPEWLSITKLARNDRYGPNFMRVGESRPNLQQIGYAYALRMSKTGWTPELRREFFGWFARTGSWQGGNQFQGFIDQIKADALINVPETERVTMADLAKPLSTNRPTVAIQPPKGPGKNYSVDEVFSIVKDALKDRDFRRGRSMYVAASCQACHRLGNDGGGVGPDLTSAVNRYTLKDLLENIIDPSKVISNQYESTLIELSDGSILNGRIVEEDGTSLLIATNPNLPHQSTSVRLDEIVGRKASSVSLMPTGLINSMNADEVIDLVAYILSAGDASNKMFKQPIVTSTKVETPSLPRSATSFDVAGYKAFFYAAPTPAPGKPWLWYAPTLKGISLAGRKMYFEKFLNAGLSIAGYDLGEVRGSPNSTDKFTLFYDEMVRRGWSSKPILLGQSRGGMMTLAWAFRHPDKVKAWVGIYPVCNLSSWPMKNSEAATLADFDLTKETLTARLPEFNPIDNLRGLIDHKVPMFAVHGDSDKVVPYEENTKLLKERYEAGGGTFHVKVISGEGHQVTPSFFECPELTDFILLQVK